MKIKESVSGDSTVNIIGAGLAGCECAYFLANNNVKVNLYEMKPYCKTPAHNDNNFCELVCSNSLKSEDILTASGLLKQELYELGCFVLEVAKKHRVPSGNALSVNRVNFASEITEILKRHPNINIIHEKVVEIDQNIPTVIATGPLTDPDLFEGLKKYFGDNFYFYDAIAPIIETESVDLKYAFWGNRYNKDNAPGDYLNCILNQGEYEIFYNELINAKKVELKAFENVFESCMPIEVLAARGKDALRFGPMKPVGFREYLETKAHAIVQLRKENSEGTLLNIVGFQTNLTFPEQKRVFSLIPALKNAEFVRFGVVHRNSYINAPKLLNSFSQLKEFPNIFIAGQLSGVEGYVESVASGLICGYNMLRYLSGNEMITLSDKTCIGAILKYITSADEKHFAPMNANFGIIKDPEIVFRKRDEKRQHMAEESAKMIKEFKNSNGK